MIVLLCALFFTLLSCLLLFLLPSTSYSYSLHSRSSSSIQWIMMYMQWNLYHDFISNNTVAHCLHAFNSITILTFEILFFSLSLNLETLEPRGKFWLSNNLVIFITEQSFHKCFRSVNHCNQQINSNYQVNQYCPKKTPHTQNTK